MCMYIDIFFFFFASRFSCDTFRTTCLGKLAGNLVKSAVTPLARGRKPESNRVTTTFVISSATPKSR